MEQQHEKILSLAKTFVYAAKNNMLSLWANTSKEWDDLAPTPIGPLVIAVESLRESYWHDGTESDIQKYKDAISNLETEIANA
jgi:hypothetical protein